VKFSDEYVFELWLPIFVSAIALLWILMLLIPLISIFTIPISLVTIYCFGMEKISFTNHQYIYPITNKDITESE